MNMIKAQYQQGGFFHFLGEYGLAADNVRNFGQVPATIDAFVNWQQGGASDLKPTTALIIGLEMVTLGLICNAPNPKLAIFAPFNDISPAIVTVPPTTGTLLSLTQILGYTFSNVPPRHDYRGSSSGIEAKLYKDVYEIWKSQATVVHLATGANRTFVLQHVPAALAEVGAAKGGNSMGIPHENHQCQVRGLHTPYFFMNDESRDQNPLGSYETENYGR
ncbi:hypothetical protein GQ44DRAFT_743936 [Phaeosphaeriaceae sp. PMI808]|nr:hypothetical protein GQ44DRAFT_743936 [Phaeosphaeriaceae sp. PMI808]